MHQTIELQGQPVTYTLRQSARARRMRLAIYGDGSFVVTVPIRFRWEEVERFIFQKSHWIIEKLDQVKRFSVPPMQKHTAGDVRRYKEAAHRIARERVDHFNALYRFTFQRISIRNQKTRWGSCSKKGNLNFNYRIALLPERLADYLVVHELCHLAEFNHSKKFWDLVAKTIPDYAERRRELKRNPIGSF